MQTINETSQAIRKYLDEHGLIGHIKEYDAEIFGHKIRIREDTRCPPGKTFFINERHLERK